MLLIEYLIGMDKNYEKYNLFMVERRIHIPLRRRFPAESDSLSA